MRNGCYSDGSLAAWAGLHMMKITQLSVRRGERQIIEALDVPPLQAGSLTALVGPNGAGKSTLIHALAGLLKYSGEVTLNGTLLNGLNPLARSHKVGLLPQTLPQCVGLSAFELLLGSLQIAGTGRQESLARIEKVLARLQLSALAFRQLDTLSGGQRQMIALAQVLVREPELMLLDEPTSALDLRWQLAVLSAISEEVRTKQKIAVLALHDLNLALRICDRILVLHQGRIVADGAPIAVLNSQLLASVYGIAGRIEHSSQGRPYLFVDHLISAEYA